MRGWYFALAGVLMASAGCTPLYTMILDGRINDHDERPLVVAVPAGYDRYAPRPAYDGPHPSELDFDLEPFDFPVALGEVGPIDTSLGPLQYPFACQTLESGLGQPLVDNHEGAGTPVYALGPDGQRTDRIVGYSKDCLIPSRAEYYYNVAGTEEFRRLQDRAARPEDMAWIEHGGETIPFVIRIERGTINRFIYAIAMLADPRLPVARIDARYWNGDLIYYFGGGVGIGKRQGEVRESTVTERQTDNLEAGYALLYSSGTDTGTHYNMRLAGHTAAMVKRQFTSRHGEPRFTFGMGGSGGAVQQFLIAQNQPGLLDALIPIYSYPDMITQTIWALDCELLEYYFDVTARRQERWRTQEQRTLVEGLAASSDIENPFNRIYDSMRLLTFRLPRQPDGATECSLSWRGLTTLTNNPTFNHEAYRYADAVIDDARFSHWHDLKAIYGVDESGYARRTYDNTGVQYGLEALQRGALSPAEFLHLNANVGTWKAPRDMEPARYWLWSNDRNMRHVSLWGDHNMRKTPGGPTPLEVFESGEVEDVRVAPRTAADLSAIRAAYWSGQVFLGTIDVPIIDVRHYLDDVLNMHHSFASLSTRKRLMRGNGHSANYVIWVAERPYNPTARALRVLTEWLEDGKPAAAVDTCFDAGGNVIAAGPGVWDGAWNGRPTGACQARFPSYESPRNVAGAPLAGDLFKCALMSVDAAIERGLYAPVDMRDYRAMLRRVFPDGVCDYRRGDVGRPAGLPD